MTFPKQIWTHHVVKKNKRLYIERLESGEAVYTPPDFLRHFIQSREQLRGLADRLTAGSDLASEIIAFESSLYPRRAAPTSVGAA